MIPQSYPLYARIWSTDDPNDTETAAIIGWHPDPTRPDTYTPILITLSQYCDHETAFQPNHEDGWNWRLTTDPNDTWEPPPAPVPTHKAASLVQKGR